MTEENQEEDGPMELHTDDPRSGLELLLALRPADLEGWEADAASRLPSGEASPLRAADARLDSLISAWSEAEDEVEVPDVRGADFVGLPTEDSTPAPPVSLATRRRRRSSSAGPRWTEVAMLAAGFMLLCFGIWQLRQTEGVSSDVPSDLPAEGWKAVSGDSVTRVALQFSVERRLDGQVLVEPGRAGGSYGPSDALVLRVDLRGDPAWVYLLEQAPGSEPALVYPSDGGDWQIAAGLHALSAPDGRALAYSPDQLAGRTRYLVLAASEPIDAAQLAREVMASGLERPDAWPRTVRAVDSFEVDWIE